jgi:hypothetical protein
MREILAASQFPCKNHRNLRSTMKRISRSLTKRRGIHERRILARIYFSIRG